MTIHFHQSVSISLCLPKPSQLNLNDTEPPPPHLHQKKEEKFMVWPKWGVGLLGFHSLAVVTGGGGVSEREVNYLEVLLRKVVF